jgi:hypothetical protein
MPISVENGPRSPEGRNGDSEKRDAPVEHRQDHSIQDIAVNSNLHLAAPDMLLPTPSPTPSPGGASPSLCVTDNSAQWMASLSAVIDGNNSSEMPTSPISGPEHSDEAVSSQFPVSKALPPHELHDIPEEKIRKPRKPSFSKMNGEEKISRSTVADGKELTSELGLPKLSPRRPSFSGPPSLVPSPAMPRRGSTPAAPPGSGLDDQKKNDQPRDIGHREVLRGDSGAVSMKATFDATPASVISKRPGFSSSRAISTPPVTSNRMASYTKGPARQSSPKRKSTISGTRPDHIDLTGARPQANGNANLSGNDLPSPITQPLPLPPMSIPTYLQLELSSTRPSPLYIHRSAASDYPYESSKIKFERLLNFLLLPPQLEQVLYFGSLACLDAWLHTFTILPLRFFKALGILVQWWGQVVAKEARFITGFIYHGSGRMWDRQRSGSLESTRSRSASRARPPPPSMTPSYQAQSGRVPESLNANTNFENLRFDVDRAPRQGWGRRHRRMKSAPSSLSSYHKADLLQGAVIVCSCMILLKLDASRMYHSIRGQSNIKLYVIYNLLEVSRLTILRSCMIPQLMCATGLRSPFLCSWSRHI